jgi:DNA-binding transcriptional LysR family regulator
MRLELRQLRHLLALDRYRNFARAAENIGLTQPALTRSIQTLEESVGARLFDRDRSRVEPTRIGARLIEESRALLQQTEQLQRTIQGLVGAEEGPLSIGAGPYPADVSVGIAVGRMLRKHPRLKISVAGGDWPELTKRVLSGELELAIAESSLACDDKRLAVEELPAHQVHYFCRSGHPLTALPEVAPDDVRAYPLVATSLPSRVIAALGRSRSDASLDKLDETPTVEARTSTFHMVLQIVQHSDAVSAGLPSQIEQDVALGRLVRLPLEVPGLQTGYGIIRLAHRTLSPAADLFVEQLREVERELER